MASRTARRAFETSMADRPLAIVPAAGFARRLGLAGSKAAVAIGERSGARGARSRVEPLAGALLDCLRAGGIREALVVRRAGGWDLAAALGDGSERAIAISYLVVRPTPGVPHTVALAARAARGRVVALGFPDVLFTPPDAFAALLQRSSETGAAVVLGLFPTTRPWRTDMVMLDRAGRPVDLVLTPPETTLAYAWVLAVWAPEMTAFLERWVESADAAAIAAHREPRMGDALRAALARGLAFEAVTFPEGSFHDVATREDLQEARTRYAR